MKSILLVSLLTLSTCAQYIGQLSYDLSNKNTLNIHFICYHNEINSLSTNLCDFDKTFDQYQPHIMRNLDYFNSTETRAYTVSIIAHYATKYCFISKNFTLDDNVCEQTIYNIISPFEYTSKEMIIGTTDRLYFTVIEGIITISVTIAIGAGCIWIIYFIIKYVPF
jgi:hypothetical protein